jgi:tRNA(fMet)-specific endonuclease VapC
VIRYMLDTNVCMDWLRGKYLPDTQRARVWNPDEICLSAITVAELVYGVWRSRDPVRNERAVVDLCSASEVVAFDDRAAEVYGQVRAQLEKAGHPIGSLDTLIASHALALDVTMVTTNERKFRRVENLRVENWRKI